MKNRFFSPKKQVNKLNKVFNNINEKMNRFQESDDPLSDIVYFFRVTSEVQDEGLAQGILKKIQHQAPNHDLVEPLRRFVSEINKSGRDLNGMNRTTRGELVSPNKVYIGGTHAINTLIVSEWQKLENDAAETAKGICRNFIETKSKLLLTAIADIKQILS